MKFCSLSSGSSGNCLYVETNKAKFIIDQGFSGKTCQELLRKIGVEAGELDFILVTHEHGDHVKGLGVLSRRFNLPIYTNEKTFLAMEKKIGSIKDENLKIFKTNREFEVLGTEILPMKIFHDAKDPVGYIIKDGNKKLSVMTDTGFISDEMIEKIKDSDLYFIEANHDLDMLERGPYPYELKKRVKSILGHTSNDDCALALSKALRGHGEKIFLGHLSIENNRPSLAQRTVASYLASLGLDMGGDVKLAVAPRLAPTGMVTL